MIEPIYLAQTHEREHTATPEARRAWIQARAAEANAKGCKSGRATASKNWDALLYEGWAERFVDDQGEPRWQYVAG